MFEGPAAAARRKSIEDAIKELEKLWDKLKKDDKRRKNLERAIKGLREMMEHKRFRVVPKPKIPGDRKNAEAWTESPEIPWKEGDPFPQPPEPRPTASKDSWIHFPEEPWVDEDPATGKKDEAGYDKWNEQASIWLALLLWHEWQHASDGAIPDDCEDVKRHICIVKGSQELAKELKKHFGVNDPQNPAKRNDYDKACDKWIRLFQGQIDKLKAECKKLECDNCEKKCPDAWAGGQ